MPTPGMHGDRNPFHYLITRKQMTSRCRIKWRRYWLFRESRELPRPRRGSNLPVAHLACISISSPTSGDNFVTLRQNIFLSIWQNETESSGFFHPLLSWLLCCSTISLLIDFSTCCLRGCNLHRFWWPLAILNTSRWDHGVHLRQ